MGLIRMLIIIGALLLVAFQNCSNPRMKFADIPSNGVSAILGQFKPAFAVRGSGCVTCHANVRASFLTDFGYGDPWAFGDRAGAVITFGNGAMYGDHDQSWSTSTITGTILVPKTPAFTAGAFNGTLADYVKAQEAKKAAAVRAQVTEMGSIYIGAPTAATLRTKFGAAGAETKFIVTPGSTLPISGITKQTGGYYQNTGDVICEGDLFIDGTLLLNSPRIHTKTGCRIYSTGSIFLQGTLDYVNLATDGTSRVNLQLSSSRAVSMGVGNSHCETAAYPGSYSQDPSINGSSPLENRFKKMWTNAGAFTRHGDDQGVSPAAEGELIIGEGKNIPSLMDASCFAQKREVDIDHLLINAPQVHSRYRGKFRGVVIAEVALMSLSKFSFDFDPVFEGVPVLPILGRTDFLVIE